MNHVRALTEGASSRVADEAARIAHEAYEADPEYRDLANRMAGFAENESQFQSLFEGTYEEAKRVVDSVAPSYGRLTAEIHNDCTDLGVDIPRPTAE